MKYRTGFVTNSSSSSFIVKLKDLTQAQVELIQNPNEEAERLGLCEYDGPDSWVVEMVDDSIIGWTVIDNFDWHAFLEKIGVDPALIQKGDGHEFIWRKL